jgi:hypothetical protein
MAKKQGNKVPDAQGDYRGLPYDWRKPSLARTWARWWNRDDSRILTPKSFSRGYDLNLYRLFHRRTK